MRLTALVFLIGGALLLLVLPAVAQQSIGPDVFPELSDAGWRDIATGIRVLYTEAPGTGARPTIGQKIKVMYKGWLPDGTVFDDAYEGAGALQFRVGEQQVVPGFDAAALQLEVGRSCFVYMEAEQGYSATGVPGTIPPNSPLIFYLERIR